MRKGKLGDRMKALEAAWNNVVLPTDSHIIARVDGRAFHTFTRGMQTPHDARLSNLMILTTIHLVSELGATLGYTQSDEISILMPPLQEPSQRVFGGKMHKMTSLIASLATSYFARELVHAVPEKAMGLPSFDCRVFSVPGEEVTPYFVWRELDAVRNSVQAAAQAYFSHSALHGKNVDDMLKLLADKGKPWEDHPWFFRRGAYVSRRQTTVTFSAEEIENLPEMHDARTGRSNVYERWVVDVELNGSAIHNPESIGLRSIAHKIKEEN